MPRDVGPDRSHEPLRRCRPALGTYVEVSIRDIDLDAEAGLSAIAAVFAAIDRVAALMSFHDAASELSRINVEAFTRPVAVDAWTVDLLEEARQVHVATRGAFDCTVGQRLVKAGLLPRHRAARAVDADASFDDVVVHAGTVSFRRPLCLDFGGIAKGYAVDRAIDALRARGIASAVINAGGDLRVLGSVPLPIHVRGRDGHPVFAGLLADGAFATSRPYDRSRAGPSQSPSALIDPATGRPVASDLVFNVAAPLAVHADALTKALAVAGVLAPDCLARFGAAASIH